MWVRRDKVTTSSTVLLDPKIQVEDHTIEEDTRQSNNLNAPNQEEDVVPEDDSANIPFASAARARPSAVKIRFKPALNKTVAISDKELLLENETIRAT